MNWTVLVMEQLSDVTYKVCGRKRNFVFHHDNLRPCRDRVVPIWMKRLRHKLLGSSGPGTTRPQADRYATISASGGHWVIPKQI